MAVPSSTYYPHTHVSQHQLHHTDLSLIPNRYWSHGSQLLLRTGKCPQPKEAREAGREGRATHPAAPSAVVAAVSATAAASAAAAMPPGMWGFNRALTTRSLKPNRGLRRVVVHIQQAEGCPTGAASPLQLGP